MAFRTKIKPYAIISRDLSVVTADDAQSTITLRGTVISSWMINTLTVITLNGGTLNLRKNTKQNDSIPLNDGFKEEGNPITELYWTGGGQAKIAKIYVAWVD